MKWYWFKIRDCILIREGEEDMGEYEGEYVAEIDIRYLTPGDLKKAEKTADEICDSHNSMPKVIC